ncbi:pyridoxamine 5'-phosphate oxidase family protein [Escherichia coli]
MVVATMDEHAQPYQRIVCQTSTKKAWCFTPTSVAVKRIELENNARVHLLFPSHTLERQVMVIGKAERLSTLEVMKIFS